jgi:hypothetical protein
MDTYRKNVEARREKEIQVLANLTGWDPADIRGKMKPLPAIEGRPDEVDPNWKQRMRELFKGGG